MIRLTNRASLLYLFLLLVVLYLSLELERIWTTPSREGPFRFSTFRVQDMFTICGHADRHLIAPLALVEFSVNSPGGFRLRIAIGGGGKGLGGFGAEKWEGNDKRSSFVCSEASRKMTCPGWPINETGQSKQTGYTGYIQSNKAIRNRKRAGRLYVFLNLTKHSANRMVNN